MVEFRMSFFSLAGAAFTVLLALLIPLKGLEHSTWYYNNVCVSIWTSSGYSRSTAKFRRRGKAPVAKTGARPWFEWASVDRVRKRLMMDENAMRVRGRRDDGATTSGLGEVVKMVHVAAASLGSCRGGLCWPIRTTLSTRLLTSLFSR